MVPEIERGSRPSGRLPQDSRENPLTLKNQCPSSIQPDEEHSQFGVTLRRTNCLPEPVTV
jgi:hypothetical protein